MISLRILVCGLLLGAVGAGAQSAPEQAPAGGAGAAQDTRDLKVVRPEAKGVPPAIPRSYALVIGIASYKNLPVGAQLLYPNRDAEDVYTALISPEGGQFPAENVHKLINEKATVANIRHELEDWLAAENEVDQRLAGEGRVF